MCFEMVISIFKTLLQQKQSFSLDEADTASVSFFIVALIKSINLENESSKECYATMKFPKLKIHAVNQNEILLAGHTHTAYTLKLCFKSLHLRLGDGVE